MPKSKAETITAASQAELENLLADLRGLLARKELEAMPEVNAFRVRIDEGLQSVRETAVETAHEAARKAKEAAAEAARRAKEAAAAADAYAHDEPWRVAGAALAVGALLGYLLGRR
ncbi:glycine zipper domain-containing protein [Variovorax sp. VNK109]|jgi:ElaB/YqjD/DUF883 family membrane-anchored ribosome-binding protein|uniref:glycine zipper domain-containing protein n=1 Tax=Variovorax sp. VNK109 TaxID=3400919 RepID=UPI003C0D6216